MAGVQRNSVDVADDWYPGKMLGLEKGDGDWYPGKLLGRKKESDEDDDNFMCGDFPLSWESTEGLLHALVTIDKVDEVLAALDVCVNIVNDDIMLAIASLNALLRIAKGQVETIELLGEGGACECVVRLFHFYAGSNSCYICHIIEEEDEEEEPSLLRRCCESQQSCLVAAVTAIECLSAGCKKNRQRLARAGACFYLVEILRHNCEDERNTLLLEATLNAVWQLSFHNKLSKKCFRDCGCENELWLLSQSNQHSHLVRHRASSVLKWLKTQLVDDVEEIFDPRTLCGALLLAVSDISMTTVKGSAADAVKIVNECSNSLENVLICGDTSSVIQDAIENYFLPATVIIVSRRILRFYKKIFHENKGGLYEFISNVTSAVCCFLSKEYRQERRESRSELDADVERYLNKIAALLPSPAIKRADSDDLQTYSYCEHSDAIILASPLEKRIISLEYDLIAKSSRQMRRAGACKLIVKSLALFVREEQFVAITSSKRIPRKRPAAASSDPLSFFNAAADTFTKGFISGLHEVQSGLNFFSENSESKSVSPSSIPYPDGPDGDCVEALCNCIRILCDISLLNRLQIFEEEICSICNALRSSEYASRVEDLYYFIGRKITQDFEFSKAKLKEVASMTDTQAVVLVFSLKILSQGKTLLTPFSKRVDSVIIGLLNASLDFITLIVSTYGSNADKLLKRIKGYEQVFAVATHKFLSNYRLAESWLKMCTDIALARIESKELLGHLGACDICMTVLRIHSLRPNIVQCRYMYKLPFVPLHSSV